MQDAPLILREFLIRDCDLWFVRLDICVPLDLVAVGNRVGKVFLFSLSGTDTNNIDIAEEINKFSDDANVDKVQALKHLRSQVIAANNLLRE